MKQIKLISFNLLYSNRGMTLMEVMISIAMLAFISLGITTITSDSAEIKEQTIKEDRNTLQVEKAFYRFAFDFDQIYSPLFYANMAKRGTENNQTQATQAKNQLIGHYSSQQDFDAISEQGEIIPKIYTKDKDTLAFFTMSNRRKYQNSKESDFGWVLYTVEKKTIINEFGEEIETEAFVRYFSADNPFYLPIWKKLDELKSQVLLTGVKKLEFSYWDSDKEKYIDDISINSQDGHLIKGLKIYLEWVDQAGVEKETTRFFKPGWDSFKPETAKEIEKLQEELKKYGKKKKQ